VGDLLLGYLVEEEGVSHLAELDPENPLRSLTPDALSPTAEMLTKFQPEVSHSH